jgi:hypothetical protein
MIHRAFVSYKDSDTITIQPGYGECSLSYWEITSPLDHDMTSLASGEDWHYIYIDDVNSVYPTPTIKDSIVEPTWSDTKLGWYNGYDRCIGVVWSPDSSATLKEFTSNSKNKYCARGGQIKIILSDGNPNGSWQTLETTAYIPVNATTVRMTAHNSDYDGRVTVSLCVEETPMVRIQDSTYCGVASANGWLEFDKSSTRDLKWLGEDNDENNFHIHINGYQIER